MNTPDTAALKGLKVVECATVIAAPLCGRLLADFGADVIHVEPPRKGDPLRKFGFTKDGINPWWKHYARNKRFVTLNISKPAGRDVLIRMLADADIFIENFRPGRLEEWGIHYEDLAKVNPRLIMVRVSGFGQTGPYSSQPGFGTLMEAMSGFADMTGFPDGPPILPTFALADSFAGFYAATAAMFAVYNRDVIGTGLGQVVDVMREADYWSEKSSDRTVTAEDVQTAIDTRIRRVDSLRERSHEMITRGIKLIDTDGSRVGQINALSVMSLGGYSFGGPSRITARVRMGKGQVVDIEREVELGGPLHSKGVLILSSFLSGLYALDRPLSLSASLVFEQSYGGIDGDSASSAELYCLLSALSGLPIKQCFAVTGSVNQKGEVQPIGGVNEKIEGFFDICKARGFSPGQGVLIPASNICHLMLRADVVEACTNGDFAIYAVETIDQGVEILTGVQSGVADDKGVFPEGTVNALVETRLRDMADDLRNYSRPPESHNASHDDSHDKMSDGKKADD